MRRIDLIVTQARRDSDNLDFSSSRGIQDESFLQWANDAQDRMQAIVISLNNDLFVTQKAIAAVAQQEEYSFPSDTYQGTMVDHVEFSRDGAERNYYGLDKGSIKQRTPGVFGDPSRYIPRGKKFFSALVPSSSSGSFRVHYYKALPKLDKRRGKISAVTLNVSTRTITSLTMDATTFTEDDVTWLKDNAYITIVDKDGTQKMRYIPITDINSSSGVVSVDTFVYEAGETIAVGDWVVGGKNGTTHCQLPDDCEQYLVRLMTKMGKLKDSDKQAKAWDEEFKDIESKLQSAYSEANQDVNRVPILDADFLDQE